MNRFDRTVLCAILPAAGFLGTTTAGGQPVAEKPDLKVGDQWVFNASGTAWGASGERRWSRRIAEMLPDGLMRVEPRYENFEIHDLSWNPRFPDRPESRPLDFQFPLRVGAEWSYSSPPGRYWEHGHYKVVAYESVTVPAGTFDCFRIEGAANWNSGTDMGGVYRQEFKFNESWESTRWYCPAVKYVAKMHVVRTQSGVGVGARASIWDSELTHYASPGETSRYDGDWHVVLACDAFEDRKPFSDEKRIHVRGGEFVLAYGTSGQPGYSRVSGSASENGTLLLDGKSIAAAEAHLGQTFHAHFEGRLDDGVFRLNGGYGRRTRTLRLKRTDG